MRINRVVQVFKNRQTALSELSSFLELVAASKRSDLLSKQGRSSDTIVCIYINNALDSEGIPESQTKGKSEGQPLMDLLNIGKLEGGATDSLP